MRRIQGPPALPQVGPSPSWVPLPAARVAWLRRRLGAKSPYAPARRAEIAEGRRESFWCIELMVDAVDLALEHRRIGDYEEPLLIDVMAYRAERKIARAPVLKHKP